MLWASQAQLTHLVKDADDSRWNPEIPRMPWLCLVILFQSASSVIRLWVCCPFPVWFFFLLENNKNIQVTSSQTKLWLSLCDSKTTEGSALRKWCENHEHTWSTVTLSAYCRHLCERWCYNHDCFWAGPTRTGRSRGHWGRARTLDKKH